jgi:very-short-patch-repair endonuclease
MSQVVEFEQALIGCFLVNNEALAHFPVRADQFIEPLHREIFSVISRLIVIERAPANPITIRNYLPDVKVGEISLSQYLARLAANAPSKEDLLADYQKAIEENLAYLVRQKVPLLTTIGEFIAAWGIFKHIPLAPFWPRAGADTVERYLHQSAQLVFSQRYLMYLALVASGVSPLEVVFAMEMEEQRSGPPLSDASLLFGLDAAYLHTLQLRATVAELVTSGFSGNWICAQAEILDWKVDFLLIEVDGNRHGIVAVELDGHEFHERTKEQAARDRSRDRDLQHCGIPILRFTRAEVYADAIGVVREARGMLADQLRSGQVSEWVRRSVDA